MSGFLPSFHASSPSAGGSKTYSFVFSFGSSHWPQQQQQFISALLEALSHQSTPALFLFFAPTVLRPALPRSSPAPPTRRSVQALRDEVPSAFLLNTVVCAHSSGEVVLQNYNTLFTLSKLAQCSDGVLVSAP